MRALKSYFAHRDAKSRPTQTDDDVNSMKSRFFDIDIISIRWLPDVDQRRRTSRLDNVEPISALFVPDATINCIKKDFLVTWSGAYAADLVAETDVACLEFTIHGQSQRFESLHHVVNSGDAIRFYPNRPLEKPYGFSALELGILALANDLPKGVDKNSSAKVLARRSQTWPSKMESLRLWSRISEDREARRTSPSSLPAIRLGRLQDFDDHCWHLVSLDEIDEDCDERQERLIGHDSENTVGANRSMVTASPTAKLASAGLLKNRSAELQYSGATDGFPVHQNSGCYTLSSPIYRVHRYTQGSQALAFKGGGDTALGHTFNAYVGDRHLTANALLANEDGYWLTYKAPSTAPVIEHENGDIPVFAPLMEGAANGREFGIMFRSRDQNRFDTSEAKKVKEVQMGMQSKGAFQRSVRTRTSHASTLETGYSKQGIISESPSSSDRRNLPAVSEYHSFIRDISGVGGRQIGLAWEEKGKWKQEAFEIGKVKESDSNITHEVSSAARSTYTDTGCSTKTAHRVDSIPTTVDEYLALANFAGESRSLGASGSTNLPTQYSGDANGNSTHFTNAITMTSTHERADHYALQDTDGRQGNGEMEMWEFPHIADRASVLSTDSEGLPFPDDYWKYDEESKNYYHTEMGDDGTTKTSWYPLEFD